MSLHRSLALAAALAAFGASALADTEHNLPLPGAPATATKKPGFLHATYFAVVTSKGVLKRGSGAVFASQPEGKGTYAVSFVSDVTNCAYVVTPGEVGNTGSLPALAATVVGRSGDPAGIFIDIFDNNGAAANAPFHVDVGC